MGERITRSSMTCPMPSAALTVHDRQLDFANVPHEGANFSSLPLGGARQIYTVSVSNNGRHFGSSQTFTVYNSTCISCSSSGVTQRVCKLFMFLRGLFTYFLRCYVDQIVHSSVTRYETECIVYAHNAIKLSSSAH